MPKATPDPTTSRRHILAALSGAALAGVTPVLAMPTEAPAIHIIKPGDDGELLALTAELAAYHQQAHAYDTSPDLDDDEVLDAILNPYWEIAEEIEATSARTPEGLQAKARVIRSVVRMVGWDKSSPVSMHVESLLRDVLGEA